MTSRALVACAFRIGIERGPLPRSLCERQEVMQSENHWTEEVPFEPSL